MTENEKVSHLMKGVAEDVYQSLLVKDISCSSDFLKECQRIEEMNQRRIAKQPIHMTTKCSSCSIYRRT
ncbi:hypothetical protein TNCT_72441 [Trichonephila clavata]|uniref:Uncharacterized protein n=1 Tax=Trichonephila clavata TaxID=2740835 RepID=A0A8X6LM40_TRICU|nr:hypothetical protein TNCT_72441 [Trichonephila clavata]